MTIQEDNSIEQVGNMRFQVVCAERTEESDELWRNRAKTLAEFLLVLWEEEQQRRAAERN